MSSCNHHIETQDEQKASALRSSSQACPCKQLGIAKFQQLPWERVIDPNRMRP